MLRQVVGYFLIIFAVIQVYMLEWGPVWTVPLIVAGLYLVFTGLQRRRTTRT